MTENKKITQLIKGLPYDIRQTMVLQTINNVPNLLEKLRNLSELYEEHRIEAKSLHSHNTPQLVYPSTSYNYSNAPKNQNSSHHTRRENSFQAVNTIASNNMPHFSQQNGPKYPKERNLRTPDGKPVCNYCHYGGHITKDCEELKFRNSRRASQTAQNPSNAFHNNGNGHNFHMHSNPQTQNFQGRLNAIQLPSYDPSFECNLNNGHNETSFSGNDQAQ